MGDGIEFPVEVGQAEHGHQCPGIPAEQEIQAHDALRVLRLGNAEDVGQRRRQVDGSKRHGHRIWLDALAAGDEGGAHVHVGIQDRHVRDVAVLTEGGRSGHERARSRGVELVRGVGEGHEVTRARRVRQVCGRPGAVRGVTRLGLREGPIDHPPALGLAVAVPIVGVGEAQERILDLGHRRRLLGGGNLHESCGDRIAPRQVEVDLHGTAHPARLGLADGLAGGQPAVRRLRLREQAEVHQYLAGVDGQELGRESMTG